MKEKQKAEAYVQQQIPELGRVQKGSRVLLKEAHSVRMFPKEVEKRLGFDPLRRLLCVKTDTIQAVRPDGAIYLKEAGGEFTNRDFTHLGSKPNFFHYLQILTLKNVPFTIRSTRYSYWLNGDSFSFKLNRGLAHSEVGTEKDYKAFNLAIGV